MPKNSPARERFEKELAVLVARFDNKRDEYLRSDYNEAQVRLHFIDPFFEALGWDVRDNAGKGRAAEVLVARGETLGIPDYTFRFNGQTIFYVEAKAPHVSLEKSNAAMQAKKYAWNTPDPFVYFAAATDFEEFRFYDASQKPDPKHPHVGLIFSYRYPEYLTLQALDDLWQLSREAVAAGSLDKLLKPSARSARQRSPLDQVFLSDLTLWREKLAKSIFKIHPELDDPADLNNVVQVFLDRLIFMRVAEDRGVLDAGRLVKLARAWRNGDIGRTIMAELLLYFKDVNDRLNGEIFKKHKCEDLRWDSALITEIILDGLEPYDFNRIGVELLGSIYERYLGKTIRVTATRAVVEDKPEVRKAGGVYYTPKYIVDYIVEQTVGKLIEGKSPAQIAKLKILDPACGSGSFLIGAYQKLLDYHAAYYAQRASRRGGGGGAPSHQARLLQESRAEYGDVKLSLTEKATILRNNIFGVDIDPQAVEITMMSLYIKMLEGERGAMMGQGVLPRLNENIKCGNSLIARDIGDLSAEDSARINPFDWTSKVDGFGDILAAGGFDAVIGNPPYGIVFDDSVKVYLEQHYPTFVRNNDTYVAFVQKSIELLGTDGLFGYIIPNTFLIGPYFDELKRYALENTDIVHMVDFGLNQVFPQPNVFTALLFLRKKKKTNKQTMGGARFVKVLDVATFPQNLVEQIMNETALESLRWMPINPLVARLLRSKVTLDDIAWVKDVGLNYWTQGRGKTRGGSIADRVFYEGKQIHVQDKPYLKGRDIDRYSMTFGQHWLRHNYQKLLDPKVDTLRFSPEFLEREKIIYRQTADHVVATLDLEKYLTDKTVHTVVFRDEWQDKVSLRYLLGILNSRLTSFLYKEISQEEGRTFAQVKIFRMKQLPICTINFSNPADQSRHDQMVALVEQMLELHKQKQATTSDAVRERLQRTVNVLDEQIDALVYELYGLTKDEIKIVEESAR